MSRAPPFPTSRDRSGSLSSGSASILSSISPPMPIPNTRPLQINRGPTPSNNTPVSTSSSRIAAPKTAPSGPSRPQRSELRSRASDYGSDTTSTYRDSVSTTISDVSTGYYKSRNGSVSNPNSASIPQGQRPQRLNSPTTNDETTPTSLSSVVSAFQSAGTRRRAMTGDSEDFEYQRYREQELAADKVRQQRIKEKIPGRRVNGRTRTGDIDSVLDQIKDGWEFVVDPDFNTVDLALQLLDESSLGKDMDSFRRTKNVLSKALKGSVDQHYQAFAASLPHHTSLLNHLQETQTQIETSRTTLLESKEALGSKRSDLVQLWSRGQMLEDMMRLLDQIEHLKSVPDSLETLMSEKRLLHASVLLVKSLKIINNPDMMEIGAVSDLRSYLVSQEIALREILLDELHNHLYLKSFWCDSRWAAYTPKQRTFPRVEFEDEPEAKVMLSLPQASSPSSPSFRQTRLNRFVNDLALRPNDPPYDFSDPNTGPTMSNSSSFSNFALSTGAQNSTVNPESDSFTYIETVLESLAVLGKLGAALDNVTQRLPNELFTVVESTLDEISERAEYGRQGSIFTAGGPRSDGVYTLSDISAPAGMFVAMKGERLSGSQLRLAALESSAKQSDHEILRDLFWTLYSKVDAIAQGLRVIYEVANRIGSRREFKDSSGAKPGALFSLSEVWMSVQAEIRVLLYDYLTNEEQSNLTGRNPISSINEVLRDGRFSRDKIKSLFRFAETDSKLTTRSLRSHEDELMRVLKDTMPGLVQNSADNVAQTALSTVGTDDRLLGAGQRHRLLIKPDAFHVNVLFQPTLAWLDRVAETLPAGLESTRASSELLDDFVLKVYLPQLEERVSMLFHQAVTGPDAFQPDPLSKRLSSEPLFKASIQLMALINSLCAMLQTTPFHQEDYSRLILGVIIQFYQRCSDRFQSLVTVPLEDAQMEPQITLAAQWAQRSELNSCLAELFMTEESNLALQQQFCRQEMNLELSYLGQETVTKPDFVPSIRTLAALAGLYRSVAWFASQLYMLKPQGEELPLSPDVPEPISAMPTALYTPLPTIPQSPTGNPTLPLSKEMSLRFQALLKTYEQLAELILDTIRIDIRCRAMYYLDSAMRFGNYSIDREASEPDPHVIDLNTDLAECDDLVSPNLPPNARHFIFVGLGYLMEHTLISTARYLRRPTAFAIKKIMRNMLALQQGIKTLTTDQEGNELANAKRYYQLFFISPQEMLNGIRQMQLFSFDEYQTMLSLQCGVDTSSGDPRHSEATDRNYSMYVIDLHGLEIENSAS